MTPPTDQPQLPTDWSGTWTGSSWGVSSQHHPLSTTHQHLDPDFHTWTAPWSMHTSPAERSRSRPFSKSTS